MKPQRLIPPLAVIESGLFPGAADPATDPVGHADLLSPPADESASLVSDATHTPVPASLRRLMAQRVQAAQHRAANSTAPLQPGQIRWIASAADRPVSLLVASLERGKVQGWIVASETLYASHEDWLVQDSDMGSDTDDKSPAGSAVPPDPRCAMVQLWNRAELSAAQLGGCAGQICARAFLQLTQVASRLDAPSANLIAVEPQPGRFGLFEDAHGVGYVCGTPLGTRESGDPRLHYRYLYLQFSQQLQRQARIAIAVDSSAVPPANRPPEHTQSGEPARGKAANMPFWRLPGLWRGAGLAAALMLAVVLPMRLWQADTGSGLRGVSTSNFGMSARFTVMDIYFSATAPAAGITELLREARGRVISAPTESGAWRIAVDKDHLDAARALFAASPLVVTFDKASQP